MDALRLLHAALYLSAYYTFNIASSPPTDTPALTNSDTITHETIGPQNGLSLGRLAILMNTVTEVGVALLPIISAYLPSLAELLPTPLANINMALHPNTPLVLGTLLMWAGYKLRMTCYKALGEFFTFDITIRPEHKLITTGPYSIVRHPSYSGCWLMVLGAALLHGPLMFNWRVLGAVTGCDGWIGGRAWWAWTAVAMGIAPVAIFTMRTRREESVLEGKFGDEWKNYCGRVRSRWIPGVV